jgi:hypothetical protein
LILFLLLAAVFSFLTTSDLTVGHKFGVSVAHVATPKGFIEIITWKGKGDAEFLPALKNAYGRGILKLAQEEENQ